MNALFSSRVVGWVVVSLSCTAFAQAEGGAKKKVVVAPFAALSAEVPARAGSKAAGMFSTELKNADGLQLVDVKKQAETNPYEDALQKARKSVAEAQQHRSKRKFRLAEEALQKALEGYRTGGPGLTDIAELSDAYALLSAVYFNTGRDEEGQKMLSQALAVAPRRTLPLAQTSPLFSRVVEDARKQLASSAKGSLQVESTPSGAAVQVNGQALGNTPLLVKEVPPGQHVWKVTLPSGEVLGGAADVAAGKTAKASGASKSKDPESRMLAALGQNKVDAELVGAAKEHAKQHQAEWVVLGALSREGKGLGLDAFVVSGATGEVRRLPRVAFDSELLSAGVELYNLAGQLSSKGMAAGEGVKVPSPVLASMPAGSTRVSEVKYAAPSARELEVAPDSEPATPAATKDAPRKPLGPRKPLRK